MVTNGGAARSRHQLDREADRPVPNELRVRAADTYGQYFDLDFLVGFGLLSFRETTARALMTRLEVFRFRFDFGFVMPASCQSRRALR
jgi:hypothetical protein